MAYLHLPLQESHATIWILCLSMLVVSASELPPCYDIALNSAYDNSSDRPTLIGRLTALEDAIRAAGCPEVSLPDAAPAVHPGSIPVGPSDFIDELWRIRAATPNLLQMQPVGLSVQPESVLEWVDSFCARDDEAWNAESDLDGYSEVQNWTFCSLYERPKVDSPWRDVLGELLHSLEESKSLLEVEASKMQSRSLAMWHADQSTLVNSYGVSCREDAQTYFRTNYEMDYDPIIDTDDPAEYEWQRIQRMTIGDAAADKMSEKVIKLRLHIPLSGQSGTRYFISGSVLTMQPGQMMLFDYYQPHSFYNAGEADRQNILVTFDLRILHNKNKTRTLLSSPNGRAIFSAVLRMGYHNRTLNLARVRLLKVLYNYFLRQCKNHIGNVTLGQKANVRRTLEEMAFAGIPKEPSPELRENLSSFEIKFEETEDDDDDAEDDDADDDDDEDDEDDDGDEDENDGDELDEENDDDGEDEVEEEEGEPSDGEEVEEVEAVEEVEEVEEDEEGEPSDREDPEEDVEEEEDEEVYEEVEENGEEDDNEL